jgi:hypothetical protein
MEKEKPAARKVFFKNSGGINSACFSVGILLTILLDYGKTSK